tara:strand:- start:913 stop:1065 length:153 start_codon:yes stop_codon:yes gene_type:complete
MWEPASAAALSIFLTVSMFFAAFLAAYMICRGFFFTLKLIKKAWEATKEE